MSGTSSQLPEDEVFTTFERKFSLWALFGASVWLVFLYPTLQQAWGHPGLRRWAGVLLTVGFAGYYLWTFLWARPRRRRGVLWARLHGDALAVYGVLAAIGVLDVLVVGQAGLACGVYVAVAGIFLLPAWYALAQAAVLAGLTEGLARTVSGWSDAAGVGLSVFLASFAVWGIMQAMRRSMQLAESRQENAELLVGQERSRMARDLHDILGHSLTVITVKAELAGRLMDAESEAARDRIRAEIADIERLSRDALADVRKTVEGYRDLSLPVEISRAKAALEAAEISATLPGSTDDVPSEWRELFAWTVREGITNVVRHSAARRCTVTLGRDRVTIVDDGRGCTGLEGGHGLVGLRERAAAVGARVIAESPATGGYALTVVVPVSPVPAPPIDDPSTSVPAEPSVRERVVR